MDALPEETDLFRQILERIPDVIWVTDPGKERILYLSPGYEQVWGRPVKSVYRSPLAWLEAIHPEDRDRILEAALTKQAEGRYDEEYRILRPDGTLVWIHDRAFPVRDASGAVSRIVGIAEDITHQKLLEKHLRESEARFLNIITIAADAIVSADHTQRIILFNKGAETLFGYKTSEVIGRPLDILIPPRLTERHRSHVQNFGAAPETARLMGERSCDIFGRRKDGTEFPARASISKWTRNGGEVIFTAIVHDLTDIREREKTIQRLAYYDPLTGLPNRILFHDRIQIEILNTAAGGRSVGVLLMDIDRFKEINDTLGHDRGDLLLQQVAERLKALMRPTDVVARLGGDEFGILIPLADPNDASLVARKVLGAFESSFEIEVLPIAVEVSIGIARTPGGGETANSLLQRADVAMYASKKRGTGFTLYSDVKDEHSPRRLALLGELRQALEEGQLFLEYQPKIEIASRRTVGAEALVRWRHPSLGIVPPGDFIGPAEPTGLIRPLTQFVLQSALRQCRQWHEGGIPIAVSVNLSVRNLMDPGLENQIRDALRTGAVEPRFLDLEITESALLEDIETVTESLHRLSRLGVRISIDDFGVGYSSLRYLRRLPVHTIKIDRSFVKDMETEGENAVIVRSTIELAHNLGRRVVAEGVETQGAFDLLVRLGCDCAQGYFFSRPIPADEFGPWVKKGPYLPAPPPP